MEQLVNWNISLSMAFYYPHTMLQVFTIAIHIGNYQGVLIVGFVWRSRQKGLIL